MELKEKAYLINNSNFEVKASSIREFMDVILIDSNEHKKMINDKINHLKTRLIK